LNSPWLGLPMAEDMDGGVADFVGGIPIAQIATHDSGPDERMLENLRALGYLQEN